MKSRKSTLGVAPERKPLTLDEACSGIDRAKDEFASCSAAAKLLIDFGFSSPAPGAVELPALLAAARGFYPRKHARFRKIEKAIERFRALLDETRAAARLSSLGDSAWEVCRLLRDLPYDLEERNA